MLNGQWALTLGKWTLDMNLRDCKTSHNLREDSFETLVWGDPVYPALPPQEEGGHRDIRGEETRRDPLHRGPRHRGEGEGGLRQSDR